MRRGALLLVLVACAQEPTIQIDPPTAKTPDAGFIVPPDPDGPVLEEPLLFRAEATWTQFKGSSFGPNGISEPELLLPIRASEYGLASGAFDVRGLTPDGTTAIVIHQTTDGPTLYALNLTEPSERPLLLGSGVEFTSVPANGVSDELVTFIDGEGLKVVPLSGIAPPRYIGTSQSIRVFFTVRNLVTVEANRVWGRPLTGLSDPPVDLTPVPQSGRANLIDVRPNGLLLIQQGTGYFVTDANDPNPILIANTSDCQRTLGIDDRRMYCTTNDDQGLVTAYRFSGEDVGGMGVRLATYRQRIRSAQRAKTRSVLWVLTSTSVSVLQVSGAEGAPPVDVYTERALIVDVSDDGRVGLLRDGRRNLVVRDDGEVLFDNSDARARELDPTGRWLLYEDDDYAWVFDLDKGQGTRLERNTWNTYLTRRGVLQQRAEPVVRYFRMPEWGVARDVLGWGPRQSPLHVGDRGIVVNRWEDGLWYIPFEAGDAVRVAEPSAINETIVGVTDDYVVTSTQLITRTASVALYPIQPNENLEPARVFEMEAVNYVLTDTHLFSMTNANMVVVARLADGEVRTVEVEGRVLEIAWHEHTQQLLAVIVGGGTSSLLLVPKEGKPRYRLRGWETVLGGAIRMGPSSSLVVVSTPPTVIDLDTDDPPRPGPLENADVPVPLIDEGRVAIVRAVDGVYLWRLEDDRLTHVSNSRSVNGSRLVARGKRRYILPINNLGVVFDAETDELTTIGADFVPMSWTGDGRGIIHRTLTDQRVSLYDLERGWSRIITGGGTPVLSSASIRASVPIVVSPVSGDVSYFGVGRNGKLIPLTPIDDASEQLVTPLR